MKVYIYIKLIFGSEVLCMLHCSGSVVRICWYARITVMVCVLRAYGISVQSCPLDKRL